ncbi:hypothetical protein ASG35_13285 [Burkholderia sp. Leaf177]|uniref:hypothetical protein n=1 Tax=Burkholderia sp. Leaf177 TaxID=1736287 RepID=UPI0006F38A61|nr:hypothetical protein [Burkholderia sp. Leaf177]KQR77213.1 hypothetical protein ASG35_13285 [Burkholderia sp. Leaf177]
MHHVQIEADIRHLERVIEIVVAIDAFPSSYWSDRVDAVRLNNLIPSQKARLERINKRLEQHRPLR